jgi:peptide-methionine (S)-S-oxide reductase
MLAIGLGFGAFCLVAGASPTSSAEPDSKRRARATFAGGCFWCMEPPFDKIPGVVSTTSGFAGGTEPAPTYELVAAGKTGHAEVVQVVFDPAKVSYARLLEVFWRNIDPIDAGGQFCDRGRQYRAAIYYEGDDQKREALASKESLEKSGRLPGPVVTEIAPLAAFYPAGEEHQDFYQKNFRHYRTYRGGCGRGFSRYRRQSADAFQQRVEQARAAFLPTFDASVSDRRQVINLQAFGFSFDLPIPGFSIPTIVGPFTVFDARATAQQSVLNFADVKRYQATKAALAAVRSESDTTRNSVSDEVAHDYLACLRADAVRDTARANVELSETLLQLSQRQRTAGTGTGIEVTRADVQLANDRQRLIRADNDRARSILQLLKTMSLRMDSPVEFTDKLEFKPADVAAAEALIDQARRLAPTTLQLVDAVAGPSVYAALRDACPALKLVQVIHVRGEASVGEARDAARHVDALLLDSGNPEAAVKELGGTGRVHDWAISRRIVETARVPVFLAGGLRPGNVGDAIRAVRPFGVDLCTGVRSDGRLDEAKLAAFMAAVRAAA